MLRDIKPVILTFGFYFLFHSSAILAQTSLVPDTPDSLSQIEHARTLIDHWSGQTDELIEAKNILDKVLSQNPKSYLALRELARCQVKSGYMYSRPVEADSGSPGGEKSMSSQNQYQPGTLERAEGTILSALQINPKFADGYETLGNIYENELRWDDAEKAFAEAEKLGSTNPFLQLNIATVLKRKGDENGAYDRYVRVIQSGTDDKKALSQAYMALADHYSKQKDYKKVDAVYQKIFEMRPDDAWIRGGYADYLRKTVGNYDEALYYAMESLKIMNYGVGQRILARCLYMKWADILINHPEKMEEGQKYFDAANKIEPDLNAVMADEGYNATESSLVKALIKKGVSINARGFADGSTALLVGANRGETEGVKMLLDLGADPNVKADTGWTPLLGAADGGHIEIVRMLLDKGADTHQTLNGMNVVTLAQLRGYNDIVILIMQHDNEETMRRSNKQKQ